MTAHQFIPLSNKALIFNIEDLLGIASFQLEIGTGAHKCEVHLRTTIAAQDHAQSVIINKDVTKSGVHRALLIVLRNKEETTKQ